MPQEDPSLGVVEFQLPKKHFSLKRKTPCKSKVECVLSSGDRTALHFLICHLKIT